MNIQLFPTLANSSCSSIKLSGKLEANFQNLAQLTDCVQPKNTNLSTAYTILFPGRKPVRDTVGEDAQVPDTPDGIFSLSTVSTVFECGRIQTLNLTNPAARRG